MDRNSTDLGDKYGERLEGSNQPEWDSEYPSMGVKSVKKEWDAVNIYLPTEYIDRMDEHFRKLRYESGDELQKARHYYLLVVTLGLERVEGMELSEVKEELERIDGSEGDD